MFSDHKKKPWEQSLGQFLEDVVARNSGKTFIEIGGQSKSYQEFYDGVRKAAAMFADLGVVERTVSAFFCQTALSTFIPGLDFLS
ncbi:MAG: hypothetical protein Ct9H300mP11_04770 [Chloroflexota bacterium]|nr:MAG: hypothetical protein Ct9H300mP11_04770 [Chloroflexota bacterium]